jgi:hypothetical protein
MIRVRDDDILVPSREWPDPFKRFSRIHRWIAEVPEHFVHVPAILTEEIQQFPQCIEYVKSEAKAGRMILELHGFHHEIDYQRRSVEDCADDLEKAMSWMNKHLDVVPKIWYTPKGAGRFPLREYHTQDKFDELTAQAKIMREAAARFNLEVVSEFDNKMEGRDGVCRHLMDGRSVEALSNTRKIANGNKEISTHWWSRGIRLKRVIEAVKHGSWANAMRIEPELFND